MIEMDGDYLVRYSGNKGCYMATLKWEGIIKHFAIQKSDEVGTYTTCIAFMYDCICVCEFCVPMFLLLSKTRKFFTFVDQ